MLAADVAKLDSAVEFEKLEFLQQLQSSTVSEINIENLSILSAQIERLVEVQLIRAFLKGVDKILGIEGATVVGSAFRFNGLHFDVSCSGTLTRADECIFSCFGKTPGLEEIPHFEYQHPLVEPGKYRRVTCLIPRIFSAYDDNFMQALINGLFGVAYKWLRDSMARAVARVSSEVSRELYQFVAVMMANDQALEGFCFSVLVADETNGEKKDIVLLDEFAMRMAWGPAIKAAERLRRNAVDITAAFMSEIVRYDESVFAAIERVDEIIEIDLAASSYYNSNSYFNMCLRGIWGDKVACFPLLLEDQLSLVCFFPLQSQPILQPFLKLHGNYMRDLAIKRIEDIHSGLRVIKSIEKSRNVGWERIGELAGGLLSGLVRSASNY